MTSQIITIILDEFKKGIRDKKILAIIFAYVVFLSVGVRYGLFIGTAAEFFFLQPKIPLQMVITYYTSAILLPLFAVLLSFDSISGETFTNSMSLLAVRANRMSIILGKYIASLVIVVGVNLLIYISALVYFYFKTGNIFLKEASIMWVYLIFYVLAFISIGFFSSVVTNKSNISLWVSVSLVSVLLFMWARDIFSFLSPFNYINNIFADTLVKGGGVLLLFAAVGLGVSLLIFKRKNL